MWNDIRCPLLSTQTVSHHTKILLSLFVVTQSSHREYLFTPHLVIIWGSLVGGRQGRQKWPRPQIFADYFEMNNRMLIIFRSGTSSIVGKTICIFIGSFLKWNHLHCAQYLLTISQVHFLNGNGVLVSAGTISMENRFEILRRIRQCHYRALCKLWIRFINWNSHSGRVRFREIWVKDEFRTNILYFTSLLVLRKCGGVHLFDEWKLLIRYQWSSIFSDFRNL